MKLIWMSDIHLNFLNKRLREEFYGTIVEAQQGEESAVVISGDISESDSVLNTLQEMEKHVKCPVYFVLGNHDYYGSGVKKVRAKLKKYNWLGNNEGTSLSETTILLGVDGWGDCRAGDYERSDIVMNDWYYIDELRKGYAQSREKLREALQQLADVDANQLKNKVEKAIAAGYQRIILVSHVPAFEDASLHMGKKGSPSGLPFYVSQCLGEAILPLARERSDLDFLWLSGHTHSRAKYQPLPNLTVKVAKAEYYRPSIEEVLDV